MYGNVSGYGSKLLQQASTHSLLAVIGKVSHAEVVADQKTRIWNEHFFWLVGLAMLLALPMFRRFPRVEAEQETP